MCVLAKSIARSDHHSIIEFPLAFIERRVGFRKFDEDIVGIRQLGPLTVLVDRPRAEDIVVLLGVMPVRVGIVDRVGKREALDWLLLDAANLFGCFDANQIKRRRQKVDLVAILRGCRLCP